MASAVERTGTTRQFASDESCRPSRRRIRSSSAGAASSMRAGTSSAGAEAGVRDRNRAMFSRTRSGSVTYVKFAAPLASPALGNP